MAKYALNLLEFESVIKINKRMVSLFKKRVKYGRPTDRQVFEEQLSKFQRRVDEWKKREAYHKKKLRELEGWDLPS